LIKSLWRERRRRKAAQATLEEMTARAARLGITPERVLEEYRRIAFANLRRAMAILALKSLVLPIIWRSLGSIAAR
jgi:hypothetical protein